MVIGNVSNSGARVWSEPKAIEPCSAAAAERGDGAQADPVEAEVDLVRRVRPVRGRARRSSRTPARSAGTPRRAGRRAADSPSTRRGRSRSAAPPAPRCTNTGPRPRRRRCPAAAPTPSRRRRTGGRRPTRGRDRRPARACPRRRCRRRSARSGPGSRPGRTPGLRRSTGGSPTGRARSETAPGRECRPGRSRCSRDSIRAPRRSAPARPRSSRPAATRWRETDRRGCPASGSAPLASGGPRDGRASSERRSRTPGSEASGVSRNVSRGCVLRRRRSPRSSAARSRAPGR